VLRRYGGAEKVRRCGDAGGGGSKSALSPWFERVFKDAFYFICSRFFR
jgi:hypothetical protein